MSLDSIVSVVIQAGTTNPSRRGFGVPLLMSFHTRFPEKARFYRSLSGMIADGFTVADPAYKMASAVLSQNPRPERILVGRLPAPADEHVVELDVAGIVSGQSVVVRVTSPAGVQTTVTQAWVTSATATATALAAQLDALTGLGATATTSVVTAESDGFGDRWYFEVLPATTGPITVRDVTPALGYDTALAALLLEEQDFYAVAVDVNSVANVEAVAAWALANERLAFFAPQVTTPAAYAPTLSGNDRAVSLPKKNRTYAEAAWMGECLPFDPGSQTWALKQLAGQEPDPWSESQITTIENANQNHYTRVAGVDIVRQGVTHGGEWIDTVRGLDWLTARLKESVFRALVNARKVPYTDEGAQVIANEVRGVLRDAANRGLLVEDSIVVTTTPVEDLPEADRLARRLTGVDFTARLAGAIHTVTINGTVS